MTDQPDSREVERVAVALANYECAKLDLTPLTGIDDFRHDYEREEYKSLARAAIAALAATAARVAELEAALRDLLPSKLCGESWDLPDSDTVHIAVTFGKIRAARAALDR